MQKILLYFFYFIFIPFSFANNTVIKGRAKAFAGKDLSVSIYSDYITKNKIQIGFTTISDAGSFNFTFDVNEITKVMLTIENESTWFFISPGSVYNIDLYFDKEANKTHIYDKFLSLKFNFPAPTELNQLVANFNEDYDNFIDKNYLLFMKRNRSVEPKINEFKANMIQKYNTYNNDYLNGYVLYSIANIYNAIDVSYNPSEGGDRARTKAKNFLDYLNRRPILYNNPEYMKLYKQFFKGEFKGKALQVSGLPIIKAINDKNSYGALLKSLDKYPFLFNDEFKNMFLLNGLLEVSDDKFFNKTNILSILKYASLNSKYPHQKIIAENIIEKITKIEPVKGENAPEFTLNDKTNHAVKLTDFKGKYVYISFFATWNIPSLEEMKIMKTLYDKYKDKVAFVSICTDENKTKMDDFISQNPGYTWPILHIDKHKTILEKYNIRITPSYVLLDKNLKIIGNPAGRPGGTAERETEDDIDKDLYLLTKK